jgi:alkylation response protein AidB-like acyl-CoA dehydrogenase
MAKAPGAVPLEGRESSSYEDLQSTSSQQELLRPIGQQIPGKVASSSTDGFFQEPPPIQNQLFDDIALQRALKLFLPDSVRRTVQPELTEFGNKVISKEVFDLVADAEHNLPYLKTWNTWGKRRDELITSEGWRKLSAIGIQEGMVAIGYENSHLQYSRPYQFCKYLIWTGSSAWVTCPSLMTDGVAALLRKHLSNPSLAPDQRRALQSAYNRLTSRDADFAWTTGQWMTERQGGSDVSQTETLAQYAPYLAAEESRSTGTDGVPLGAWLCSGFKWFSSATDSSMMVFLARTTSGISTFMAPMRKTLRGGLDSSSTANTTSTELNGIQIQRLKNKLGTRALPTAELVLKNVRAHLIGEEGNGVREIAMVLNVARVHNAVTAIGFWGRGLSIIRAFARVRKVGLKPLWTKPAFVRSLAKMHVDYRANVLLSIFVASLLGVIEQSEIDVYRKATSASQEAIPPAEATAVIPDPEAAVHIYRLLTPVLKGLTAKAAIAGLSECMECMGGVGYLENDDMQFNIARLSRDVQVCSIWYAK